MISSSTTSQKKPDWIRSNIPISDNFKEIKQSLKQKGLFTVCEEAKCPNLSECWTSKTATIMILGDTCTRACRFCNVKTGNPKGKVNSAEIANTSEMVKLMNLRYVVITSVDRDDLPDQGAGHFAAVIEKVREDHPEVKVEVLIPDFKGEESLMHILAKSNPFVIAQNIETVERLTHLVRDRRAGFQQTLNALAFYKKYYPHISTKSSLMVGHGETLEELLHAMDALRQHHVDIVTFGQYLRPTHRHLPVQRYYHPDEFEMLKEKAYSMGFSYVASGPLVRSSYHAADYIDHLQKIHQKA